MVMQVCTGFVKGKTALASDLCQEVFIHIWNAMATFEARSTIKTWIYRITVNTCLQYVRKQGRNPEVPMQGKEHQIPNEPVNDHQASQILYVCMGKLPEIDRLLMMMVLNGLGYQEISDIIGISHANVRVKVHRIKHKLKKLIRYERQHQ